MNSGQWSVVSERRAVFSGEALRDLAALALMTLVFLLVAMMASCGPVAYAQDSGQRTVDSEQPPQIVSHAELDESIAELTDGFLSTPALEQKFQALNREYFAEQDPKARQFLLQETAWVSRILTDRNMAALETNTTAWDGIGIRLIRFVETEKAKMGAKTHSKAFWRVGRFFRWGTSSGRP